MGFLAEGAYLDAAVRRHLYLMVHDHTPEPIVAGFILFGGVYPVARIQQIGVRTDFRRAKVGSRLLACLASDLEKKSYLSLTAKIASDLPDALSFYRRNGFEHVATRKGGTSRNREILVHSRDLETPTLFSAPSPSLAVGVKSRLEAPIYAFDLNVLFDLVRSRERHELAGSLFGAALDHRIRLAVAQEFIGELRRTSATRGSDPILQMALRLPQLPGVESDHLDRLAADIHELVFVRTQARGADSLQAKSDCRHLAHASLARATAFVTSDNTLLKSQQIMLTRFGVDVVAIDELLDALPPNQPPENVERALIGGYQIGPASTDLVRRQLELEKAPEDIFKKYLTDGCERKLTGRSVTLNDEVIAFACLAVHPRENHYDMLVHVRPDHIEPEALADYLISFLVRLASRDAPAKILLDILPGQATVRQIAKAQGFEPQTDTREMAKIAVGRPLTPRQWRKTTELLRRRTGVTLDLDENAGALRVAGRHGPPIETSHSQAEDLLGPTLIALPSRSGVIVPIAKRYADELLDTSAQLKLSFIESKPASLLTRRAYVNSPRTAKSMLPGGPIFFYESGRSLGRAAVVAVARIVDSVVVEKNLIDRGDKRRLVVDDVNSFSQSGHVLLTNFDNLLPLPKPVPLSALRTIGAAGRANLISATPVTGEHAIRILDHGWTDD